MAYRAEIQIGVVGLKLLEDLERKLTGINSLVTRLNKTAKNPVINTQNITSVSSSVANLNKQLQQTLNLQQQISKQRIPAAPPGPSGGGGGRAGGGGRPSPSGKKGSNIGSAISSAAIGGAFPLLFGQGAGAAVGGAIGGVAGELALGPAGGFAGSLIGTAVGAAADADIAVAKLAANLDLTGAAAEQFGQAFRDAGVDLQAFTGAVNEIQTLNLTFEQQATAIQIATAVSGNYKGSITAVATALQELGNTGRVNISTLQTLTAANVPVVQTLAKEYGVSKDKIMEMAAKGEISVSKLIETLRKLGNQSKEQNAIDKLTKSFSTLTANVNKVLGPTLEQIGKVLGPLLDRMSTGFGYIADVLFPKLTEALAPISKALSDAFPSGLLNQIAGFFQEVLIRGLEATITVIGKLSPIVAAVLNKFKQLSNNPVFKFIADQVARLAKFLGLSGSNVTDYANKQKDAANKTEVTADKAEDLADALERANKFGAFQAWVEKQANALQRVAELRGLDNKLIQAQITYASELDSIEASKVENSVKYAKSLNEVSALINSTAIIQKREAERAAQQSRMEADMSVQAAKDALYLAELNASAANAEWDNAAATGTLTADKQAQLENTIKQVEVAEKALKVTEQTAELTREAAAARLKHTNYTIDLERREAIVVAYAEEYARQTERAVAALERQSSAIDNQLRLVTTINQAQSEINSARISMLRIEMETTANYDERVKIINAIYALEKANAKLKYESTVAQIKAEVAQQQIAYKMAEAKYAELLAVVKIAEAQGVVNQAHYQALDAQASALNIAKDALDVTYKTAAAQLKAADAVYRTNLALLEQERIKEQSANTRTTSKYRTGEFSGSSTQVLTYSAEEAKALGIGPYANSNTGGQSAATYMYNLEEAKKAMSLEERIANIYSTAQTAFASGGYVTGATSALIGEAGPEYVIPAGKMEEAMARYASGRRGSSVIPDAASTGAGDYSAGTSSINPVVNVTTGPVMNMNNSNYVSQADFLAGLQAASRQGAQMALATLQNNSSTRRAVGVR